MYFKLFALVSVLALAVGEPVPGPKTRCDLKHPNSGLSSRYHEAIAHAIHSMDLESLRVFVPNAPRHTNGVPTVNIDLSSDVKVLEFAPSNAAGSDFSTDAMNLVDRVLAQVGVSDDGLGSNWSPLERVVHNFHMKDLWNKLKPVFDKTQVDAETCACLTDVNESGIKGAVNWVALHYARGTPITLLNRPIPVLKDAETWKLWKDRLLHYYTEDSLKDAAYFLKCKAMSANGGGWIPGGCHTRCCPYPQCLAEE